MKVVSLHTGSEKKKRMFAIKLMFAGWLAHPKHGDKLPLRGEGNLEGCLQALAQPRISGLW